jgi:RNA methyltransferase, TrmH family
VTGRAPGGTPIASPANPRLKAVLALRRRRGRARSGKILIDGHRALELALAAGVALEAVYHCPERDTPEARAVLAQVAARGVAPVPVAAGAFARIAFGDAPDSVVAVARRPMVDLDALRPPENALVVVAAGLEKPGNLGALVRAADGAGAHAVLAVDGADPFGPNAVRASRGTVFSVPLVEASTDAALAWLTARGLHIVATLPGAELTYTEVPLTGPVAVVLGEEHRGLPEAWRRAADAAVRVPLMGAADSLNVAVTGALLLYEALRQRRVPD